MSYYNSLDDFLQNLKHRVSNGTLYIVGAGHRGAVEGLYLNRKGIPFEAYIDMERYKKNLNGKEVVPYTNISKNEMSFYLISSDIFYESMRQRLVAAGVSENNIIAPLDRELFDQLFDDIVDKAIFQNIIRFNGLYKNQRCFIIGNGPSLNIEDLNKLRNDKCFACNGIYHLYDYTNWRPSFFCAGDTRFVRHILSDSLLREKLLNDSDFMFLSSAATSANWFNEEKSNNKIVYYRSVGMEKDNDFSDNCFDCIYSCKTVAYAMLQLAVYMGFSEIYLLGIDFTFTELKTELGEIQTIQIDNNIIEAKNKEKNKQIINAMGALPSQKESHLRGYLAAKQYADAHGIKIYNATRGGKLEVFPRVDFDSLFEN